MSAASAFAAPIVREVGGKEVTFPLLTMKEYGQLEEAVKEKRRKVERALLDECNIGGKDRLPALRQMEMAPVLIGDVINYLNSVEGTRKALVLSAGSDVADEVMKTLPFIDANDLVGQIAGLGEVPPDPQKAGGTGLPTPPASEQPASSPQV